MIEQKTGLIYPNGEEVSWEEVDRKAKLREINKRDQLGVELSDLPPKRDLEAWHEIMQRRQEERQEVLGVPESVRVDIETPRPILVGIFGDVHAGGESVDYERFAKDIDLLKKADGFSITVGDLTDSFFFGSGQHEMIASNQEQMLYMQAVLDELSKDNRLLAGWSGDHDCLDEKTEVYTKRGWLRYDEFNKQDELLTISPDNGLLEWHNYEKKIVENFSGELIRINSQNMDILATQDHRVFYKKRRKEEYGFINLKEFANLKWPDNYVIPNASSFKLPDYPITDDYLRIIAWIITDGWISEKDSIRFVQRIGKAHLITEILDRLGLEYTTSIRHRTRKEIDGQKVNQVKPSCVIRVTKADSQDILKSLPDKHKIPEWLFDISDRQFGIFLESLIDGDGTKLPRMKNSCCFYQKDKEMIDDLQALCSMHNIKTSIYEYQNRSKEKQYRLNINQRKGSRISKPNATKKYYEGKIWDVSIPPNRNFLVRRNGKPYFTGNSWVKDKMGVKALYHDFGERYNAHYLEGTSYLTVGLNDNIDYKMTGAHRHKGFSVYNDAHAPLRMEKDEARGSDIAFTAHNHVKAHLQQTVKDYGGSEHPIHLLALGAYKETDAYSRKFGWPRKDDASMGGFGVILYPDEKDIDICWTIEEGLERLNQVL